MKKTILLIRPRISSERWASLVAPYGIESLIEPLLVIEPTSTSRPAGIYQAIIFTSAHAPEALENAKLPIDDLLSLPCFCVGISTGEAARDCGFTNIVCGTSDSTALADIIVRSIHDKRMPLLHITSEHADPKIETLLTHNGLSLTSWILYRAIAVDDFTETTRLRFITGSIDIIPVFSPRSARILVSIIEKNHLTQACHKITAIALSQAVADVLKLLPWRRVRIAVAPAADHVIASLQTEISMTQTEKPSLVIHPPPSQQKLNRSHGFAGWWLGILLLMGIGFLAIVKYPFFVPPVTTSSSAQMTILEKRVDSLETRLNALTEIPAASPTNVTTDDTAVAETVKDLQRQMTELQSLNTQDQRIAHQWIVTAFAFLDLREAAANGHPFTSQLSAFRKSLTDPASNELLTKLDPYAASPPPTVAQLKEQLLVLEPSIVASSGQEPASSLWQRLKAILSTLISIRPLHNPQLVDVEKALDDGNASDALDAYRFLPDDIQHQLSMWKEKLEGRVSVDNSLATLSTLFTTSPGAAPLAPESMP